MTPTSPSPFGTPHWPLLNSSASETIPNLSHLISQTDSVTLSPAPSLDSTSGSPKQDTNGPQIPSLYLPQHLQIPNGGSPGPPHLPGASPVALHRPLLLQQRAGGRRGG